MHLGLVPECVFLYADADIACHPLFLPINRPGAQPTIGALPDCHLQIQIYIFRRR